MPYVKIDTGILNSTLWFEKMCRDVFLTALFMAEPFTTDKEMEQIEVQSLNKTGWKIPPGLYGFVHAAGIGILRRALIDNEDAGLTALEQLGSPENTSRSQDFEGRRLVRVDGGYLVLNYFKYRDRDYTAATRSKRYRERLKRHTVASQEHTVATRNITHAVSISNKEKSIKRKNLVSQEQENPDPHYSETPQVLSEEQKDANRKRLSDLCKPLIQKLKAGEKIE